MTPESRTVSSRRTAAVSAQPHRRLKDVDVKKNGRIPGGKRLLPMPPPGGVYRDPFNPTSRPDCHSTLARINRRSPNATLPVTAAAVGRVRREDPLRNHDDQKQLRSWNRGADVPIGVG